MTTPPSRDITAPEIYTYPPQVPGINTSTFPTVTAPTFPATTVAAANTTGVDVIAYITNGSAAMSAIKINSTNTGLGAAISGFATVYIPAGATFTCTYASGTPTWVWVAV